jgi:ABC-2 type transport system permease protein
MMAGYSGTVAASQSGAVAAQLSAPPIELKSRIWYNPELKSVNFIVPGIIAVIMMIVGAIMTAMSIVKEKERGTMEQILVSPIRPLELMIGKIVPYVIIAFIDLVIIVCAGYLIFHVPIKGSLLQLTALSLVYLTSSLGTGVFVSTIADTMQSAMLAALFLSLLPSVLLSGFIFPIENMPVAIQLITYLFPGRYFITAIRGVYLKGVGLSVLWPEALMLLCFSTAIVWLSASRFQEKLG